MSFLRRSLPPFTLLLAVGALYLHALSSVGVLGPDEPRYAAIGLAMANTGDFVTPKLWGAPWFEKPALLYWLTAAARLSGAAVDTAGRIPVALLSLGFLVGAGFLLRREFGADAGFAASAMLATSTGWIAYSGLCVTDIPLAVFFSLAVLLCLPLLRKAPHTDFAAWRFLAVGASLGLASLAKGLVPLVLALPMFWFLRAHWRRWWLSFAALAGVAGPWYIAVTAENGMPFLQEFFVRHHFERLYSSSLQHVQPWYYYAPVLLAALFPWTPALALLPTHTQHWDERRKFLLSIFLFGFIFFSLSVNKLPGYLLPIVPALFALIAAHFEENPIGRTPRALFAAIAILVAIIPLLALVIPGSLVSGRLNLSSLPHLNGTSVFCFAVPFAILLLARRPWIFTLLALSIVANAFYLQASIYPVLDERVSARTLWLQLREHAPELCDAGANRDWIYGLSFYRGSAIPPCGSGNYRYQLRSSGHQVPTLAQP